MAEKPVEEIALDNGLTLELYDQSRRVAGDRWLVHLLANIVMDVERDCPRHDSAPPLEAVKAVLGPTIVYSTEKKSHFVDQSEKDAIFRTLRDDFLKTSEGYLSHPQFPGRYILRQYAKKTAAPH